MEICGKPMIAHVIERVQRVELIAQMGQVILAIPQSEPILYRIGEKLGIKVYQHSTELDVLGRFFRAAREYNADPIIRITGDCPLIDPSIIAGVLQYFLLNDFDYVTNRPSFPDGFDCEVFSYNALRRAFLDATSDYDQEHVTSYFRAHPEKFSLGSYTYDVKLPEMKVSIDTKEELELVRQIMTDLGEFCNFGSVMMWWELNKHG